MTRKGSNIHLHGVSQGSFFSSKRKQSCDHRRETPQSCLGYQFSEHQDPSQTVSLRNSVSTALHLGYETPLEAQCYRSAIFSTGTEELLELHRHPKSSSFALFKRIEYMRYKTGLARSYFNANNQNFQCK